MTYIKRKIATSIQHALKRGKSVLLLGARQTGKTTLIKHQIHPDLSYSFIQPEIRSRYEQNPSALKQEIQAEIKIQKLSNPLIAIDEIQKVPQTLDVIQDLIDTQLARFILTGSSARKLKYGSNINLLPGRIVLHYLDPLTITEMENHIPDLNALLLYGSLPGIIPVTDITDKELDLKSYVKTYLEEEIRSEAIVRNIGPFAKFLFLAASESGQLINYTQLSQSIGVSHTTIMSYYQVLEDCLIVEKIEPIIESSVRKRLSKAPKYLFFDLGVRRLAADEGIHLPLNNLGYLFEQMIGLELIRHARWSTFTTKIFYWRSHDGPEVDYVLQKNDKYIPIEVKWTEIPILKDIRHLKTFLEEYPNTEIAYLICRTPKRMLLHENIIAIPWQEIGFIFQN